MRFLSPAVFVGLLLGPAAAAATTCSDGGCPHSVCFDATSAFAGTITAIDPGEQAASVTVERAAGDRAPAPGETVVVDFGSLDPGLPDRLGVGDRVAVLGHANGSGGFGAWSWLPLDGDVYRCWDTRVPVDDVLAAALQPYHDCLDTMFDWAPECGGCGCGATGGPGADGVAMLAALAALAARRPRRCRSPV